MPTYADIGEDWERDWITFSLPQVPPFLALCLGLFFLSLGVTAAVQYRRRQYKGVPVVGWTVQEMASERAPSWL